MSEIERLPIEVRAYHVWRDLYYDHPIDETIKPFLKAKQVRPAAKLTREASFQTTRKIAKKMGISQQSYVNLEKREAEGTVTLKSLEHLARALDCDLIYALVPKNREPISWQIWKKIYPIAIRDEYLKKLRPHLRANAIASMARKIMNDAEFRRQQGWSERGLQYFEDRLTRRDLSAPKVKRLLAQSGR